MKTVISLWRHTNLRATIEAEDKYKKYKAELVGSVMSEPQLKQYARDLGLNVITGEDDRHATRIEISDGGTHDKKHEFRPGTWIDEDTDYGLSTVLAAMGLPCLSVLLSNSKTRCINTADDNTHYMKMEWDKLAHEIEIVIEEFKKRVDAQRDQFVLCITEKPGVVYADCRVQCRRDAVDAYERELARDINTVPRNYLNGDGHFFLAKRLKVCAIIPGCTTNSEGLFMPCTYVVYNGNVRWYLDAMKTMVETVDYVLAAETPDEYTLKVVKYK